MDEIKFGVDTFAEAYDTYLVPSMFQPCTDYLLEQLLPLEGQTLLDVGCGTGVVAITASSYVGASGKVIGVDPSPAMIAIAKKKKVPAKSCTPQWIVGTAEKLPIASNSVDIVTSQHVLQFTKDPGQVFQEISRVLKPGGYLGVVIWSSPVTRFPGFVPIIDTYKKLGYREAAQAAESPFSWKGGLDRLATLANENNLQIKHLYEKIHQITFNDYRDFLRPSSAQLGDPNKAKVLFEEVRKSFGSMVQADGKLSHPMPALYLIATRKVTSRL